MPIGGLDRRELRRDVGSVLSFAGFAETLSDPFRGRDSFAARRPLDVP
jgi:hypothetical protein